MTAGSLVVAITSVQKLWPALLLPGSALTCRPQAALGRWDLHGSLCHVMQNAHVLLTWVKSKQQASGLGGGHGKGDKSDPWCWQGFLGGT